MAKSRITITHSCGHTSDVQVEGRNRQEADRKAGWLLRDRGNSPCWECQKAAERAEAEEAAAAQGLPAALTGGSDKQNAYALVVRARRLPEIEAAYAKLLASRGVQRHLTAEQQAALADAVTATLAAIRAETSARWWLDAPEAHHWLDNTAREVPLAVQEMGRRGLWRVEGVMGLGIQAPGA